MTTYSVTGYTVNKGNITSMTVSGYTFNVYDAVTYGAETRYAAVWNGTSITGFFPGTQFASSPLGSTVEITTPTAGTVTYMTNAVNSQIYIAGVYQDGAKTLNITYNGETLTGGEWVPGTNSWIFYGQSFTTAPPSGTVISYQYVSPAPPPTPGKTYIPTEGRVPEANLLPAPENRVPEADLTPDVRDVPRVDLVPEVINKGTLILS